jgi:hypothetical protein
VLWAHRSIHKKDEAGVVALHDRLARNGVGIFNCFFGVVAVKFRPDVARFLSADRPGTAVKKGPDFLLAPPVEVSMRQGLEPLVRPLATMPDSDGNFAAVVVGKLSFAQVLGDVSGRN